MSARILFLCVFILISTPIFIEAQFYGGYPSYGGYGMGMGPGFYPPPYGGMGGMGMYGGGYPMGMYGMSPGMMQGARVGAALGTIVGLVG
uniref:Uncharacterized protein n=1 Tax=Panagrellus redivivus TaxID=6233 RepID=A0A7E4W5Y0_PANRE